MFCNQCGTQNAENATFCTRCGNALTTTAAPYAERATLPNATPGTPVAPAPDAQMDGKAVASLILGILAVTVFWIVAGIPAIILGHLSRNSIRRSVGRLKGEGMALAGLIMGYVSVAALPLILIIAAIAIPNLLRARMMANETSAIASVRTIVTAADYYRTQHPEDGYPASLQDLAAKNDGRTALIDEVLASGLKQGYRFEYTSQADGQGFELRATPVVAGNTGVRQFCADQSGVLRFAPRGSICTEQSERLE